MDSLAKAIATKTGISEDIAKTVIQMVLDQLKKKLPAPFNTQLEGILNGDVDASKLLEGGGGFLSKLFGGGKK
jgi:hypothetical protein